MSKNKKFEKKKKLNMKNVIIFNFNLVQNNGFNNRLVGQMAMGLKAQFGFEAPLHSNFWNSQ